MRLVHDVQRCGAATLVAAVALGGFSGSADADAVIESGLGGNTSYDGWDDLTNNAHNPANHGVGYPGYAAWTAPIVAHEAGSGDGELNKVSGAGYVGNGSLYSSAGGTFSITDPTVLANLETIVFAIALGEDITSGPALTVNGATAVGAADHSWNLGSQLATIAGFEVTQTTHAFQWDLSAFGSAITSFDIAFDVDEHAQLYALQLEQGDSYAQITPTSVFVPEPTTLGLLGTCGAWVLLRRKRA